ncbi:MAG: VCBS repeat-containing protein [Chitinophagaceae bacterium]|nr:VCBS repeat-containing protein [Chitinophagaceae bacterium]
MTDALWTDFDKDGKVDLVLTGEWMAITFLKNTGTAFVSVGNRGSIGQHLGWWNSLVAGDFDNDGDIDYVAGNLGLNSSYQATADEPMTLYAKDLDNNGSLDAMVFCYMQAEDGIMKPFPMHTKDDLVSQLVSIRKKYPTYKDYGLASMNDLWTDKDKENAIRKTANDLQTSYIENEGGGKFRIRPLPPEAQAAPVYGMMSEDVDGDGFLDLLLVGNDYGMEPYSGRHDAFNGLFLKGDGRGNFKSTSVAESGFFVRGDAKGLARIHGANKQDLIIATQNQDSLLIFAKPPGTDTATIKWIDLKPDDFCADIIFRDKKKRRVEFYYGSTYLSQSSRKFALERGMTEVMITNFKGNKRKVL